MNGPALSLAPSLLLQRARRHCYRCTDCLSVFCLEDERPPRVLCACGGIAEWLGFLKQPSGRTVTEVAALPVVSALARPDGVLVATNAPDERRRDEYRAALQAACGRVLRALGAAWQSFQEGAYLNDAGVWKAAATAHRLLHQARASGSHERRLALLAAVAPEDR